MAHSFFSPDSVRVFSIMAKAATLTLFSVLVKLDRTIDRSTDCDDWDRECGSKGTANNDASSDQCTKAHAFRHRKC